jgi:hypothetical protein
LIYKPSLVGCSCSIAIIEPLKFLVRLLALISEMTPPPMTFKEPTFNYNSYYEGGTNVPVFEEHSESGARVFSDRPGPPLTPIGMSVGDERRMFRSPAEGSAMDQGGAAGERGWHPETEYPAVTPGSGNPMRSSRSEAPGSRSLGYVPSGSVSSRPPVRRNNPMFGLYLPGTRPAVSLGIPHSKAAYMINPTPGSVPVGSSGPPGSSGFYR